MHLCHGLSIKSDIENLGLIRYSTHRYTKPIDYTCEENNS